MTTFLDGPAAGQHLCLRRSPVFLRVTNAGDRWDALDQLQDTPEPGERIYVYQQVEDLGHVHMNRGRHGSGFFRIAKYKMLDGPQPADAVLRSNARWREWAYAEAERRGLKVQPATSGDEDQVVKE